MVAQFPQPSQSLPAATATYSETPCVCACPSDLPKLCRPGELPQEPLIFQSKLSIFSWNSLREWWSDRWPAGAWTWSQTWTLPPDQLALRVLSAPRTICVEFEFFLGRFNTEIEDSSNLIPTRDPHPPNWCIVLKGAYCLKLFLKHFKQVLNCWK